MSMSYNIISAALFFGRAEAYPILAGVCTLVLIVFLLMLTMLIRKRIRRIKQRRHAITDMITQVELLGNLYVIEIDPVMHIVRNSRGNLLPEKGIKTYDFIEMVDPQYRESTIQAFNEMKSGERQSLDINLKWQERFFMGHCIVEHRGGQLVKIIATIRDITVERAEQMEDITVGNTLQTIFQTSMAPTSFYGPDGMLIDYNEQMKVMCEFNDEREEYFRKTCMFDTQMLIRDFDRNSREVFHVCQHMYYPEIGIDKYLNFRIRPTFDENDKLKYYVVTARDISAERKMDLEQRQREAELKAISQEISQYEDKLHYLLNNSDMYVWSFDLAKQVITFTQSLREDEYKETFSEYIESMFEDERETSLENMKQLLIDRKPMSIVRHFRYTPHHDYKQWLAISGMPTFDDKGQLVGYFGVLRNVDDLMTAHEQLRKERTRAEASGMMKSAFLANMTHEIRTPLNAIVGFSDLLQIIDNGEDKQEFIRIIRNNCDMLLRLINDILEASDTGQALTIIPNKVDFAKVFDDICQTLQQRIQEPGVQFIKDNPYTTLPAFLDKGRIQQVVTNFVTNAIKYTHQGHIKVGFRTEERHQQEGLFIYCEDTGTGIPMDKQGSIFERFVKLNDFVQGTGLGLSICKTIAERSNGEIGVISEGEGKGSTFWIWIPLNTKP